MNRLNLTQMVNKNLFDEHKKNFLNFTQSNTAAFLESDKHAVKTKETKKRLKLDAKVNNIILQIHEKLKEHPYPRSSIKASTKSNKTNLKIKNVPIAASQEKKEKSLDNIECKNISLPRMKALCNEKHKKSINKSTGTVSKYMSFDDHKRIVETIQRHDDLQKLLTEHKAIKANRFSLEQDIFALHHSLDDLQHRINNSQKQLKNQKTYCEHRNVKSSKDCGKCNQNKT